MELNEEQCRELVEMLRHGEREQAGADGDCACGICGEYDFHMAACRLAHWLRVLGGETERQRQVDDAHGYAAYVPRRSKFLTSTALDSLATQLIGEPFDADTIFGKKP